MAPKVLSLLDLMIAAHAIAAKAVLVTHDQAFSRVPDGVLAVEDWVIPDESQTPAP
jgi:tRNA(fMet)-specific endonuclease VapC